MEARGELAPILALQDDVVVYEEKDGGTRALESSADSRNSNIETRNPKSSPREPQLETKPENVETLATRNPRPEARDPNLATGDRSIAILPFVNLSDRKEDTYRVDGIHGELISVLSRIRDIKTNSRNSTLVYRDTEKSSRTIGEELGVAALLTGAVQWAGDRIKISVQLTDAAEDENLWGETYMRDLTTTHIFDIQSEICGAVARELQAVLSPDETQRISDVPTGSLAALEAYFRGKEDHGAHSRAGAENAIIHLEEAVSLDPDFALAHALLGRIFLQLALFGGLPLDEGVANAEARIVRALELDHTQSEIHAALGFLRREQGDFRGAESAYKNAIELNPNDADGNAGYAFALKHRIGSSAEVAFHWRKAYEVDPRSERGQLRLAFSLEESGQVHEARKVYESLAAQYPTSQQIQRRLGLFYIRSVGRFDEAIVASYRAHALGGTHNISWQLPFCYWALGDTEQAITSYQRYLESEISPIWSADTRVRLLKIAGDDISKMGPVIEQVLKEHPSDTRLLGMLTDIYLTSGHPKKARAHWAAAYPDLLEPWVEIDGTNVQEATNVARVLIVTGEQPQANRLIAKALPVAESLGTRYRWHWQPRIMEATLHALAGDERNALDALRRYFESGGSPYWILANELKPYLFHPEYVAMAEKRKAELAVQLERIREMEARGELVEIPAEFP